MTEQERKTISEFEVCELEHELSRREGVETSILAPDVEASIKVSGPARVLVVID